MAPSPPDGKGQYRPDLSGMSRSEIVLRARCGYALAPYPTESTANMSANNRVRIIASPLQLLLRSHPLGPHVVQRVGCSSTRDEVVSPQGIAQRGDRGRSDLAQRERCISLARWIADQTNEQRHREDGARPLRAEVGRELAQRVFVSRRGEQGRERLLGPRRAWSDPVPGDGRRHTHLQLFVARRSLRQRRDRALRLGAELAEPPRSFDAHA